MTAALATGQAVDRIDPDLWSGRLFIITATGLAVVVPLTENWEVLALESTPIVGSCHSRTPNTELDT